LEIALPNLFYLFYFFLAEIVETTDDKKITREQIIDINFVGKMFKEVNIYERSKPIK